MNDVPEFKGNVKAIPTDLLVDKAAEELYPAHVRKEMTFYFADTVADVLAAALPGVLSSAAVAA